MVKEARKECEPFGMIMCQDENHKVIKRDNYYLLIS